ncbi:acyl-CoA thioesterase [Variovorax rhizosphaerae]|uniref:Acyl-CoA thioesterase n=1 Tax=Variovorax rhizosphaerae TaxID=1836200 RepID=A0ABU8WLB8_9BURK
MTQNTRAIDITEIVFPEHANHYGTLFGGNALLLMSKAAFLAARQYAKADVVMARCADAQFVARVPVGSVLRLRAFVSRVGRSSITVCVTGIAERLGEEPEVALNSVFEMVAVDAQGKPTRIPHTYLHQELETA